MLQAARKLPGTIGDSFFFLLVHFAYLTCKQCELASFSPDPADGTPGHTMQLSPCSVAARPGVSEELMLITAKTKLIQIVFLRVLQYTGKP